MSRSTLPAPSTSSMPRPAPPPPPARVNFERPGSPPLVANRFEVLGLIGVGGMGSVYRARDVTLDETVALKVIARDIAREPGMLERFRREVKLARRVTHPNVARCFDIGEDGDDRFFTMELIDGESLGARLIREQRLSAEATIAIAIEVCAGLGAAHRAGVVHRDLKPDNVILATDGRVVLTDFGIASARLQNDGESRTVGIIVGTPEYMAPEQVEGVRDLDGRADIYSLGAMMFELLTGTAAWTGPTSLAIVAARLVIEPPDPRRHGVTDDALAELVLRCMARRRDDRFADVFVLARALRGLHAPAPGGSDVRSRSEARGGSGPSSAPPASARVVSQPASSNGAARPALRDTCVMVLARADEDDAMAIAVAEGLGDLVERHLRGATTVRVVSGETARATRSAADEASGPSSATEAARAAGAAIVLDTTVALAADSVAVDVSLVNVVDGLVLSTRQYTRQRSQLFVIAEAIARDVAEMLLAGHTPTLPSGIGDAESLDLWLRARVEAKTSAVFARDRAVAMFERAVSRSPDDLWILAGYAATLVDRFREAETPASDLVEALEMAERVIRSTDLLGEAWLARAIARFELGDSLGAVTDIARAGRVMPGYGRVHAVRGRVLMEVGAAARARRHLDRATALEPALVDPRLDIALAAALAGERAVACSIVDDLTDSRSSTPDAWLMSARLALWAGDESRARALRAELGGRSIERFERAAYVLDAAAGGAGAEGVDYFAWLAGGEPVASRRSAAARRIEAELAAARGDLVRAIDAVDAATATRGFFDVAWLDGCPLLEPLRASPRFVELRAHVCSNRRDVLEILEATQEPS